MSGEGLAVRARRKLWPLDIDPTLRFTDCISLPKLRQDRPDWRGETLAPVTLVQDAGTLPEIEDRSLSYLLSFGFFADAAEVGSGFEGACRVLDARGTLLTPVPLRADEQREVSTGLSTLASRVALPSGESGHWSFENLVMLVAGISVLDAGHLRFVAAIRTDEDAIFAFQRKPPH